MSEAYDYNNPHAEQSMAYPVPQDPAPAIETQEPTVEEHANMIRKGFEHVLNKALEASELAKRVAELETELGRQKLWVSDLQAQCQAERDSNAELRKALQEVQSQLAQRDSTVHDLVMERDRVRDELDIANGTCGTLRTERCIWEDEARAFERALNDECQRNHILEERCSLMQTKINALKEAFNGLNTL